ncbi:hypothetical protein MTR67_034810 [Solanum verrucosum]|uniref:Uncharacterized protein n=1 Tax=Solanum verrucosum TaxID=315347 RepID=A0AAF0U8R7_SOLVR|nr:hypothetical protein MTR67_034810 [Solanum verrucosum]
MRMWMGEFLPKVF